MRHFETYLVLMRASLICILLVLLASVGCTKAPSVNVSALIPGTQAVAPPRVTLHMDVDFTPAERADAQTAADTWRIQTGGLAVITLVYDLDFSDAVGLMLHDSQDHNLVVRRFSSMSAVAESDYEAGCDGCVLGWMNAGGLHGPGHQAIHGAFVIDRLDSFPNERLAVMLHEFGHVLGVPHVGAYQAIMFPSVHPDRTTCLKKPDLVAFCDVNECGAVHLYPCE